MKMSLKYYKEMLARMEKTPLPCPSIPSKYRAKKVKIDGITFDSKKEGSYYLDLKLRVLSGEVLFFTMQTTFHLPGGVRHRIDFVEYWKDGTTHFVDTKGMDHPMGRMKRKQVEALYPITIEIK